MKHLSILSFLILSHTAFAQLPVTEVIYDSFAKDIIKSYSENHKIQISYWLPPVFWDIVGVKMHMKQEEVNEIKSILTSQTTCVLVSSGTLAIDGSSISNLSEAELINIVTIEIDGKIIEPLKLEEIEEVQLIMKNTLEPLLANMMGEMGRGIKMLFFRTTDIDPYKKQDFKVNLGKQEFTYTLPVPSLYPNKICTKENESYPSNYNYCPIHGNKIE